HFSGRQVGSRESCASLDHVDRPEAEMPAGSARLRLHPVPSPPGVLPLTRTDVVSAFSLLEHTSLVFSAAGRFRPTTGACEPADGTPFLVSANSCSTPKPNVSGGALALRPSITRMFAMTSRARRSCSGSNLDGRRDLGSAGGAIGKREMSAVYGARGRFDLSW